MLASRSLREDLEPTEPGRAAMRLAAVAAGLGGAGLTLGLGGFTLEGVAAALLLVAIGAHGVLPLAYGRRAFGILGLSSLGLIEAALPAWIAGERLALSLWFGSVALAGGLLFRAHYRAARSARVAVAIGAAMVGAWFVATGHIDGLTNLELDWQSWAPQVPRLGIALGTLLSLLAFMDASTTAGARVWAAILLFSVTFQFGLEAAIALWPLGEASPGLPLPALGLELATAAFVLSGAVGLAGALAHRAGASLRAPAN